LPGLSGGGVFDKNGKLVGIIKASASIKGNKYKYDGKEGPADKLSIQSLYVPCRYVNEMVDENIRPSM